MFDSLRPILYHLFIAGIIGGLWFYADLERAVALGLHFRLPPISNDTTSETDAAPPPMRPMFNPATGSADAGNELGLADDLQR